LHIDFSAPSNASKEKQSKQILLPFDFARYRAASGCEAFAIKTALTAFAGSAGQSGASHSKFSLS
jgi:hypothetical protein